MKRAQAGFTLVELVVAMVLLGAMLLLMYGGLNFAARGWDAGDASGRRIADRRVGENFLRRELSELFPMRWKDPTRVLVAFDGAQDHLRFVSSRPDGFSLGGLAIATAFARPGSVLTRKNDSPAASVVTNSRKAVRRFSSVEGVGAEVPFGIA